MGFGCSPKEQQRMASLPGVAAVQRSRDLLRTNPLEQLTTSSPSSAMRHRLNLFGDPAAPPEQQMQQLMREILRTRMIGQSPIQQPQMLPQQSRQKMEFIPGSQFLQDNSSLHNMGMMGSLGLNSQLRANGPPFSYGQHTTPQNSIMQKFPGQSFARASSPAAINSQFSSLTLNSPSELVQNAISQKQWPNSMQPVTSRSGSSSYQLQQQQFPRQEGFMPRQLSSSSLHPKAMDLSQQHLSQLVQQQQQQFGHQVKLQHLQQIQQLQQQQNHHQQLQQQSPRMAGSPLQKSFSLSGSEPDPSLATTPRGSTSQGTDKPREEVEQEMIYGA